jgi:hypothetical protein
MTIRTGMTRRTRLTLGALLVLALAVAGVASAATGVIARTPHYGTLASVGVSAGKATVAGRDLRLTLRLKHSIALRFAIVSGKEQIAWNGPAHLAPGVHTITRRLHGRPSGGSLRLRITSRKRSQRGRGFVKVRIIAGHKPPTGVTNVSEPPAGLALSNDGVAENRPAGTAVGTLAATDPDAGATYSYALATGSGDDDNGAFTIDGATLRTAAAFDFETRSAYSVRIRVSDGRGGTFEQAFTVHSPTRRSPRPASPCRRAASPRTGRPAVPSAPSRRPIRTRRARTSTRS